MKTIDLNAAAEVIITAAETHTARIAAYGEWYEHNSEASRALIAAGLPDWSDERAASSWVELAEAAQGAELAAEARETDIAKIADSARRVTALETIREHIYALA